jgi:hypothetical protein
MEVQGPFASVMGTKTVSWVLGFAQQKSHGWCHKKSAPGTGWVVSLAKSRFVSRMVAETVIYH